MLFKIINDFPNEILSETEGPFISLYQPTHRHRPENEQDVIRFKNLIKEIESSLEEGYSKRQIDTMLKPFYELAEDAAFWNHTLDGLAILATKDRGVIYKLQRPVKELVVVADSFHIKPLIRIFQSADRYQLLGLNRNEFTLYEGNRYGFSEVEMEPGTLRTSKEFLGSDDSEKYLGFRSVSGAGTVGFYGQGGRKDELINDTTRFFNYVDQFILENYSKPSGLPLILVSLPEHHSLFQEVSDNPFLMKGGIEVAFDALSIEDLRDKFWDKIEYQYLDKTNKLVDSFETAAANSLGSDDLAEVAQAATENRVATLLIESDKIVPGKIDSATGELTKGDLGDPQLDDVLDDLAEMVFSAKGDVIVLPEERMPSKTGVAAIFRY